MSIEIRHAVQIQCPVRDAYEALTIATKVIRFFPNEAHGDMKTGTVIEWKWGQQLCPVTVLDMVENEKVVLSWQAFNVDYDTVVTFTFDEKEGKTKVTVRESGWESSEKEIRSIIEHSAGWMHFLLCMKAHIEHGIDLRA